MSHDVSHQSPITKGLPWGPLALVLVLAACSMDDADLCPPMHTATAAGCELDEAKVSALMRRFDDGQLEKINVEPFQQVMGEPTERNVFINRLPLPSGGDTVGLYLSVDPQRVDDVLSEPFPVGTVLVHERVDGIEGSTIQVRMGEGYENAGGGPWWFGKFFADGTPDENPCNPCEMCHNADANAETEGLWGVPSDAIDPGL